MNMNMSFREKSAWACLITTVLVFVPYFGFIFRLVGRGELVVLRMIGAFIAVVLAQIILSIVYHIAIAVSTREEPKDERDIAIENKALRCAHWVLVVALWLLVPGSMTLSPLFPQPVSVAFMAQLVLLSFVLSELVHYGTQAYCYRKGS